MGVVSRIRNSNLGRDIAIRYRLIRKPRQVVIHGVTLEIDRTWAPHIIEVIYRDDYERPEAHVLQATLRASDRYFEIGASIGVIMTIACKIVGDRRVTAVEANPSLIPVATETAAANGFNPEIINAVLGSDEKAHSFYLHEEFWASSLTPAPSARELTVPGRSFIGELQRTHATYLMLDIEGAEIELLDCQLPASVRGICMELHPTFVGHDRVQHLLQRLMAQGFTLDTEVSEMRTVFLFRE